MAVAQAVEQAATPNRCHCYLPSPGGARGFLLRPQGDVSCAEAPPPQVPWRIRGLAPVARALRWSSSRLLPCGNDTVLSDPQLVYDLLLRWRIQGNLPVYPNCSKSVRRSGARRTCRTSGANGGRRTACGCNTTQLCRHHLRVHLVSIHCQVLRPAGLPVQHSPGGNRLIVRAFTTPLAAPTNKHRVQSIHQSQVPCSSRESTGPRRRLNGCQGIHHTRSPNCAKGHQRAFQHFVQTLSCRLDPPQTDGACWLHMAHATSTDRGLLILRHSRSCPLMTFTELYACSTVGLRVSSSADVSCTTSQSRTASPL